MKAIILCSDYSKNLYPLTAKRPKALLEIKGKALIENVLESIEQISEIDEIFIATNDTYYNPICNWGMGRKNNLPITVVNDFTNSPDNQLGIIDEIKYVIDNLNIDDDVMVCASDKLFSFKLNGFFRFYSEKKCDIFACKNETILPYYILSKQSVSEINDYLIEGNNPEDIARFIEFIGEKKEVCAWEIDGEVKDIETIDEYLALNR